MQSVVEGQPDAWTFEREAARGALRSRDPREFVDALLRDGDIQLAWGTAAAAPQDELGPELRLRLAESCEARSPADAVAVYQRVADEVLQTTDRRSALECYASVALGVGGTELAPGERVARELVAAEPFRERAHALLMEILAARGNAAEALRVYGTLRKRLRDELGATPAPELRALREQLLRR